MTYEYLKHLYEITTDRAAKKEIKKRIDEIDRMYDLKKQIEEDLKRDPHFYD